MKISVITSVLNNVRYIEDCIRSVVSQNYGNVEYVVIDGGSTDGTLEVIKRYADHISHWISESDDGIYEAMNKGIDIATGDVVCFLNSDDFYVGDDALGSVASAFIEFDVQSCFGDIVYVNELDTDKVVRRWISEGVVNVGNFKRGWHPPHPAFFVKKSVLEKHGGFNPKYRISADYELMLRLLLKHGVSTYHIEKVLVKMRLGGKSNSSVLNILKANLECYRSWGDNDLEISPLIFVRKPLSKIKQYFGSG